MEDLNKKLIWAFRELAVNKAILQEVCAHLFNASDDPESEFRNFRQKLPLSVESYLAKEYLGVPNAPETSEMISSFMDKVDERMEYLSQGIELANSSMNQQVSQNLESIGLEDNPSEDDIKAINNKLSEKAFKSNNSDSNDDKE